MSDQAFWQSIIKTPADDTPRLIYSDWLEDHDQLVRAEFTRIQCELAKGGSPNRDALIKRQNELMPIDEFTRNPSAGTFERLPDWIKSAIPLLLRDQLIIEQQILNARTNGVGYPAIRFERGAAHITGMSCLGPNSGQLINEAADTGIVESVTLTSRPHSLHGDDHRYTRGCPRFVSNIQFERLTENAIKKIETLRLDRYEINQGESCEIAKCRALRGLRTLCFSDCAFVNEQALNTILESDNLKNTVVLAPSKSTERRQHNQYRENDYQFPVDAVLPAAWNELIRQHNAPILQARNQSVLQR